MDGDLYGSIVLLLLSMEKSIFVAPGSHRSQLVFSSSLSPRCVCFFSLRSIASELSLAIISRWQDSICSRRVVLSGSRVLRHQFQRCFRLLVLVGIFFWAWFLVPLRLYLSAGSQKFDFPDWVHFLRSRLSVPRSCPVLA
jgi:hypothetical protein